MRPAFLLSAALLCVACLDAGPLAQPCDPQEDDCPGALICVAHQSGGACLPEPESAICSRTEEVTLNVTIRDRESLEAFLPPGFDGCVRLVGDLRVEGDALEDLAGLERLVEVEGLVTVIGSALTDLSGLDGLRTVSETVQVIENGAVARPGLRSLTRAGAFFWSGPAGEALALDALNFVDGVLDLSNLEGTSEVSLPSLSEVGALRITFNPDLSNVRADRLSKITGELVVRDNPALSACFVDQLREQASPASVDAGDNGPCE